MPKLRWWFLVFPCLINSSCYYYPPYGHFHQPGMKYCAKLNVNNPIQMKNKKLGIRTGMRYFYQRISHFPMHEQAYLERMLSLNNIKVIQYQEIITLMIPIDQYFVFDSERISDVCYDGLKYIIDYIMLFPCTNIYVAAFSDNVGEPMRINHLSQARAESMLTFLWANGIPSAKLVAQGLGPRYPIADHQTVRGAAMNRHIEIQWTIRPDQTLENDLMGIK